MEAVQTDKSIKLLQIALLLLFALPILPSNAKAVAIGALALYVVIHTIKQGFYFNRRFFLVNAILFIGIAITYSYSENTAYASRKMSGLLSLFIFPLLFSMLSKEEIKYIFSNVKKHLSVYIIAVFALNVIPFIWFYATQYSFDELMTHFPTVMRVKMGKWNIHPIYLSMHCSVAILFSFYVFKKLKKRWQTLGLIFIDITLILFLLLYAKKGPLIALVIVFAMFMLFQRKERYIKGYLLAVIGLVVLTVAIPRTRNKFIELQKIETLEKGKTTSTNIRYTIYGIAKSQITKSPWIGYGIGDYNDTLQEAYVEMGNDTLIKGKYNAHNQYFSFLLIGGVVVFLLFIATIGINMVFAIRYNNQLLILLLLFYGIVMFTENILERESGIIYFALFLNFFSLKSLNAYEK